MLITVTDENKKLSEILTPAQVAQINGTFPKNAETRVVYLKVITAGRTVHLENN